MNDAITLRLIDVWHAEFRERRGVYNDNDGGITMAMQDADQVCHRLAANIREWQGNGDS